MIAKISKGGSFGGAVDYVLDKGKNAELLAGLGVRMRDNKSITRSLEMQAALNPHLSRPVGHIVLAFSAQDAARLDNRRMVGIADCSVDVRCMLVHVQDSRNSILPSECAVQRKYPFYYIFFRGIRKYMG